MSKKTAQTEHHVEVVDDAELIESRPIEDAEMDITPMIDITFLLLIFFIVASRIDEDTPVTLPPAKTGTAVAVSGSAFITIGESDLDQAFIYLGDGKSDDTLISANDPEQQETEIMEYLQTQLDQGKTHVVIKAEKGVKHGDVSRVSMAVGKVQAEATRSLYVAVLEQQ